MFDASWRSSVVNYKYFLAIIFLLKNIAYIYAIYKLLDTWSHFAKSMIIDIFFYVDMWLLIHCADLEDDDV